MEPCLTDAVDALERATAFMLDASAARPEDALAGATPYLRLFALARGGTALAKGALAAHRLSHEGNSDPALACADRDGPFLCRKYRDGRERSRTRSHSGAGSVHAGAAALCQ